MGIILRSIKKAKAPSSKLNSKFNKESKNKEFKIFKTREDLAWKGASKEEMQADSIPSYSTRYAF